MEFKQLRSFVTVVQSGSFTRAAEKLYLSQPTVSIHVQALEAELGSALVRRTTRSAELTAKGQEFYEFALRVLTQQDELLSRWEDDRQSVLKLGASSVPTDWLLPQVLPAFLRDYPQIRLVLRQGNSREILDGVRDGSYDLGLVGVETQEEALSCLELCSDRMVLIAPALPPYTGWTAETLTPALLQEQRFILREEGSGSGLHALAFLEQAGLKPEKLLVAARVREQDAQKKLVIAGLGISLISRYAVEAEAAQKQLLVFPLPGCDTVRRLCAAYLPGSELKPAVHAFLSAVRPIALA